MSKKRKEPEDFDFRSVPKSPGKKPGRKANPNRVLLVPTTMKASEPTHALITANAKRHAKGNISAWLRYAGVNCKADGEIEAPL